MTVLAGVGLLLGGGAFGFLALVTVVELLRRRSRPAASARFGAAFLLLAATSAAHATVVGLRLSAGGTSHPGPLAMGVLLMLVPLLLFVGLRVEALTGERAERFIVGIPTWLPAVPLAGAMIAGGAGWNAIGHAERAGLDVAALAVELPVLLAALGIGSVLTSAQVERRRALGGWSVSALSLAAMFPGWGFMHATLGLVGQPSVAELAVAALSLPAALHFLWVVRAMHRSAQQTRRRRPLVGPAARATRRSPWAGPGADGTMAA